MKGLLWTFSGQGIKLILQVFYILGLAIILGPNMYGQIAIIMSIIVVLSPFCGIGYGNILIKNIATKTNKYKKTLGSTIVFLVISFVILEIILVCLTYFIFGFNQSLLIIALLLGMSDLIFLKISEFTSQIYLANANYKKSSIVQLNISLIRASSLVIFEMINRYFNLNLQVIFWVYLYVAFTFIQSVNNLKNIFTFYGNPDFKDVKIKFNEIKEGIQFSISLSAQGIYNDVDKTVLGKFSGSTVAGYYSFAYKISDVVFFPVKALLSYTYPKFFEKGKNKNLFSTFEYAKKLSVIVTLYNITVSAIAFFILPYLFKYIGFLKQYQSSLEIVNYLLLLPILKGIHYLFSDALTGSGHQGKRTLIQVTVSVMNLILSVYFIKIYSWKGAVIASLISDTLMVIFIFLCNIYLLKKMKKVGSFNESTSNV